MGLRHSVQASSTRMATENDRYSCMICMQPMKWPTLFHCGHHLSCFGCCWAWIQRSYESHAPELMDGRKQYAADELELDLKLGKTKCPCCSRSARYDDIHLRQLTVLPFGVAQLYPDTESWSCPFCNVNSIGTTHLKECKKKPFQCPRVDCGEMVLLEDKDEHNKTCCSFQCPWPSCASHKQKVKMTREQYLKHQKKHKLHSNGEDEAVDADEADDDEDYEVGTSDDDDDDDDLDSIASH